MRTIKRVQDRKSRKDLSVQITVEAEEEETTLATRTVTNMTGKAVPIINTETSIMKVINKICKENPAKKEQYISRTIMNQT